MTHAAATTAPFLVALALGAPALAGDLILRYEAAQGALPTERCWELVQPAAVPAPTIVDGTVLFGPTTTGGSPRFEHEFPPIDFIDGAAIEASVRVDVSSYYAVNPFRRTGYSIRLSDRHGKWAALGIAADRILLHTADQNWSDQTWLFNSTGAFHTYRLEILGSTAKCFVNGRLVLTDTVGSNSSGLNRAYFGDLSGLTTSTTRTAYVQVEGVPVCSVADIDCSGAVDGVDLATLIGAWGTSLCEADLNEDGLVDGQDLAILLGLWG